MVGLLGSDVGGASQPAFPIYQALSHSREKQFAQFAQRPLVEREAEYFLKEAKKVETVDDFLNNRRLMAVALSAFGMDEEINYMGRIKKVMSESIDDKDALMNKLIDPRFKEIATEFALGDVGTLKLGLNSFLREIVEKFKVNEFEKYLGEQNPALREVEYFKRNIGKIENTYNILGDKVLRSVVTFGLQLPPEMALQSIEKQKSLIDKRLDFEDFKDPEFVDKFVRRFLILKDAESSEQGFAFGSGSTVKNAFAIGLLQGAGGGLNLLA
jgi:hypothetical protein